MLQFQVSHKCPISACRARGWGGLCSGGIQQRAPAVAGLCWHSSERPGRAGRAWRAGCDVNPGGGWQRGPQRPNSRAGARPCCTKNHKYAFPSSQALLSLRGSQGPRCRGIPRAVRPSPAGCRGGRHRRARTCRAQVNIPALPVAGWNTQTRPPQSGSCVCSHKTGACHIEGAQWAKPGVTGVQGGLLATAGLI